MRTTVLFIVAFAILAVTLAAKKTQRGNKARDIEKSPSDLSDDSSNATGDGTKADEGKTDEPAQEKGKKKPKSKSKDDQNLEQDEAPQSSKPKKKSKSTPNQKLPKKNSKKAPVEEEDEEDSDDDFDDLLDEDIDSLIPTPKQLTNKTNPIALGKKIANITDPEKKKEAIKEMKEAMKSNKSNIAGKFYRAALVAMKKPERAGDWWRNQLQNETEGFLESGKGLLGDAGNVVGNARKLVELDPIGVALRQGDAVLLSALSDGSKNLGKVSDTLHDIASNAHGIAKTLTAPLRAVPLLGEVKDNFDRYLDEKIQRGKFFAGTMADSGAQALGTLADDSSKRAAAGQQMIRKFTQRQLGQ